MGGGIRQPVPGERMGAGYRDKGKKAARHCCPGPGGNGGVPKGQRPVAAPYFRLRRMTFLQVAVQVRLCRAWALW